MNTVQKSCNHIRWLIRKDMPDILDIEKKSFPDPWLEEDFIKCLRQRNCIGMCIEYKDRVAGFMIYELHKDKLHVLNFAVHPIFRRLGLGTQMVERLIGKLSHERRNRIILEVRETNLDAQLFFKSCSFSAVNILKGFYDTTDEDAYLMRFKL